MSDQRVFASSLRRTEKLYDKWAIACLASNLAKKIRTDELDEVVPHVQICGECTG